MAGAPVDDGSNLFDDFPRPGVSRIEKTTGRCQFALRDRGMPCFGRTEHRFSLLRKAGLKNVVSTTI
jgi:hypothetical protein